MRKPLSPTIVSFIFSLAISSAWFISCRKTQEDTINSSSPDNSTELSTISANTSELVKLLAARVERHLNTNRTRENITTYAGQANWDQSFVIERNDGASRLKNKKAKAIVYTPFSKKNERRTAAILQSTVYETDTVFQVLYPQQYQQYGFAAHTDTSWNANDLFNVFASFDYKIYGTSQYIVNDGRIFGKKQKDTLIVTMQPGAMNSASEARFLAGSKLQSITICNTWTSCVYAINGTDSGGSCKTTTECTSYWIEIGDGGGGSYTPGTGGGGGGAPGNNSNNPGLGGTPCPTPVVTRYNERAPEAQPCSQPWEAKDIINDVTDPCLKKMVAEAISRDCSNEIANFINSAFHKNPNLDLIFKNEPLGSLWAPDAKTEPYLVGANRESCVIRITLNSSSGSLVRASREYIAITILHEAIHAWISILQSNANSSNSVSHDAMASSANINLMANGLREMYPGISLQDAKDLAWGGLQKTTAWAALPQSDKDRINRINYEYKTAIEGTPCK